MIYAVISLIVVALAYLVVNTVRLVRSHWRAFTRLSESVAESAGRLASVEAPERRSRPDETPLEVRTRIARRRECGREQRLGRTIDRWRTNFHD